MKNVLFNTTIIAAFILCTIAHASYTFEAEEATRYGLTVATSRAGYSGSGYITGFDQDDDRLIFDFEVPAGLYTLFIGYASPFGDKGYECTVNGRPADSLFIGIQETFTEHNGGKFELNEGENTIVIGKGWGWFEIDYIKLIPTTVQPPQKPCPVLVDPNAGTVAQTMFCFLVDQYGSKTLSGQQTMNDINYIIDKTGKSPALGCFDLMDYSPSRIAFGANPTGLVEGWINWAEDNNGLVSLCWHWNAPTDLINQPGGQEWWRGFYTEATTFDLKAALDDKASEAYQLLLRDMDAIAVELNKFQDANIPVLWRPLHEAAGGWFWWGAQGKDAYMELWRLMFDRFTRIHGLHHLIWVCTPNNLDWYPGDDVVDVIGLDIYTDPSSSMSSEWENAQDRFNGVKLVALTESGTLPDPDTMQTYGIWWSWYSLWGGQFIRNVHLDQLKETYLHEDVITLDELPDWRAYTCIPDVNEDPNNCVCPPETPVDPNQIQEE